MGKPNTARSGVHGVSANGPARRLATVNVIMYLIMRISYIDHKTEEYIVACSHGHIPNFPDGGKAMQTQKYRETRPAERKKLARTHMAVFRGDYDLRAARQARNSMAHNIDTITGQAATGAYVPAVEHRIEDIKAARDAADRYIQKMRQHFMGNPRYRKWQENCPATDMRSPPG